MKNMHNWPFLFEGVVVTGESYLAMLQNSFLPKLRQTELVDNTIFQQDGAPCHFACNVRLFLNDVLQDRWISRGGSTVQPGRSPVLSLLDFFLSGHVKSVVYSSKPNPLDTLHSRIIGTMNAITETQLENVFMKLQNQLFVSKMMVAILNLNNHKVTYAKT
jgi:hypothetical protein